MDAELQAARRVNWSALTATHAGQRPHHDAIRFRGRRWTWAQFDARVSLAAAALRARGVRPGDRVAVLTLNRPEFLEIVVAAMRIGAIAVPLNFRLGGAELAVVLADCTPTLVLVEAPLRAAYDAAGYPAAAVLQLEAEPGVPGSYEDALAAADADADADPHRDAAAAPLDVDVDDNATALIMYTSGTTGPPKGAMLTHLNLFVQGLTTVRAFRQFDDDEVTLIATPMFHIGATGGIIPMLLTGGVIVVHPLGAFDPAALVDVLAAEAVTGVFLVPAQWQAVVAVPGLATRRLALRSTSWGAAPASPTLLRTMAEVFAGIPTVALFGQTEMSPVTCVLQGQDAVRKLGSVGRPVPYVAMRIVDPVTGDDVAPGRTGEAVYRGPTTMAGYWNRPDADAEAFAGGWFHSGDLVRADEEGFVYVVDRKKDVVISGGENISCPEVEDALAAHPAILEVAVVGRPSEQWGEEPVAFVVLREGTEAPTVDALRAWLGGRLAGYKQPRDLRVCDALPRTASGKVQKFALREMLGA